MSDMDGFLVEQIANAFEKDHRFDAQTIRALRGNVGAQQAFVAQLRASRITLENENASLKRRIEELEKPSGAAIRAKHQNEDQQGALRFSLVSWAVSQRAFKELAIRYGKQIGKTTTDVVDEGSALRLDALDNRFDEEHNTNTSNLSAYSHELNRLRAQIHSDAGFEAEFDAKVAAGVLYRIGSDHGGWRHAIAAWKRLADEGNHEAMYNLGWCYENGKVSMRGARDHAQWKYKEAFAGGEPLSAEALYRIIGPSVGDDEPGYKPDEYARERNRYLAFGLARGDAWALAAAEHEEGRRQAKARERALFDKASCLHVGDYQHADALSEAQEAGYFWAKWLAQLSACRMWIGYENVVRAGGLFSFTRGGDVWLYIHNTTDSPLGVNGKTIEPDKQLGFKVESDVKVSRNPMRNAAGNLVSITVGASNYHDFGLARVFVPDEFVVAP